MLRKTTALLLGLLVWPLAGRAQDLVDAPLWDEHYLSGDMRASVELHAQRLLHGPLPKTHGARDADEVAAAEELELRFFAARVLDVADSALGAEVLEEFLETERAPMVDSVARSYLGYFLWKQGRIDEARQQWRALGFFHDWWIVGPFENERGSGLGTPYGPERGFDPDETFPGKRHTVSWRSWGELGHRGRVDLGALMRPNEESLAYLMTHVYAPHDGSAVLRIGSTGAYALWLNGTEVARRDVERRMHLDQDDVEVMLTRGWNRLLVKSGNTKGPWLFRIRATELDGTPIPVGVQAEIPPQEFRSLPLPVNVGNPPGRGAIDVLEVATPNAENLRRHGWLLAQRHAHDRNEHPDRELYARAIEAGGTAVDHFLIAATFKRRITHTAEREENRWRRELERAIELDPDLHLARVELARYQLERFGNLTRAASLLEPARRANPSPLGALLVHRDIVRERHGDAATASLTDAIHDRLERELNLTVAGGRITTQMRRGELDEAERQLGAALTIEPASRSLRLRLAELMTRTGRIDGAREAYGEAERFHPHDGAVIGARTAFERSHRQWQAALDSVGRAVSLAPDDEKLRRERGEILLALGHESAALEEFRRALELEPNQPRLREYVEYLAQRGVQLEDEHRIDVSETIAAARAIEEQENVPARVLLDNTVVEVNADGTTKRYRQLLVRINNDRGTREFDVHSIPYASGEQWVKVLKARVHHGDGSTEDARIQNREPRRREGEYNVWSSAWVNLPPLEHGDVVELEYRIEDLRQSFFGDYFGDQVTFAGPLPRDRTRYTLVAPAAKELFFHRRGLDVEPVVESRGDRILRRWELGAQPHVNPEPGMPPLVELVPLLSISTFEDWNAFSRWYSHLIRKQFESSAEIEAKVAELTADAQTPMDKVRAIYNFVVTEVRYIAWEFGVHGFKPYNATTIFTRRFGDCKDKSTLICTMLDHVGIEAYPVLIHAGSMRKKEDLTLPLVNHFNHCIAYVPDVGDGTGIFLDGTAQHHSVDQLPLMDRGARVLLVKEDGGELADIPWNTPDEFAVREESRIRVHADGVAKVTQEDEFTGDYAVSVRAGFEIEGQRVSRLEQIFGRRFPGTTVEEVTTSPLDDLDTPVTMRLRLAVPDYIDESSGEIKLPPLRDLFGSGERLTGTATTEDRDHDLLLGNPSKSRLRVEIELPPGYRVAHVPEAADLSDPHASYRFSAEAAGQRLTLTQELELRSPRVPSHAYSSFKDFADQVMRSREERIVLKKTGDIE